MTLKLCDLPDKPVKVIPFQREPDEFEKAMLELIELNKQGKVAHFVGVWNLKESPATMHKNWWGQSCTMCLGMAARMMEEINRWINGEVEE